jgi:hypothetical protein
MSSKSKKWHLLHPFLFAAFPIIFLYAHNINQVLPAEVLLPTAISLGLVIILMLPLWFFFGDIAKVGFGASIFFVFLFAYGPIFGAITRLLPLCSTRHIHAGLMPIMMCGLAYSEFLIKRTRRNLSKTTGVLNIVSATLIIISLTNIAVYKLRNSTYGNNTINSETIESHTAAPATSSRLPDIYYIILDRYPSAAVLREFYDFDNSEFVDYLARCGFYVASQSHANYLCTAQSLASSLNMKHITYLGKEQGEKTDNWMPTYAMLLDNQVWRFLKSKGYKFIHFGSEWYPTCKNNHADMNVNLFGVSEFWMLVYKTTMLYPITRLFGIIDPDMDKYKRVHYQFDKLSLLPSIKEPTFVFAHFLVPHEPPVFDENGSFLTREKASQRSDRENFLTQIVFINKKMKALISKLQSDSDPQPVIVVQSDEGPYPQNRKITFNGFNWEDASNDQIREKMGILNAYYLPDVNADTLYPSITPVNSFRTIFNLYFGTDLELLPDDSYVFSDVRHIYKFINVTDKLKQDSQ